MSNYSDYHFKAEKLAEEMIGKPSLMPELAALFGFIAACVVILFYAQFAGQPVDLFAGFLVGLAAAVLGFWEFRNRWVRFDKCVQWHVAKLKYENGER